MKAVLVRAFGPFADVRIEDISPAPLKPGQVRIQVALAAANPPDWLMAQGKYQVRPELPFALGVEGAGVVIEVADDVTTVKLNDRVMSYAGQGCFAEQVVAPAHLVYPIPASMPFEIAGGFALVYGTAYHALVDRGQLAAGETVVVLGAAGGIGLCAIQIAKALGATVIALASSAEKRATCRAYGADHTIESDQADLKSSLLACTNGKGADIVLDPVGGALTMSTLRALRTYGRHLIVGYSSGEIPQIPANYLLLKQVSVIGVSFRQCAQNNPVLARTDISALTRMWQQGTLKPHVAQIHPFEKFADAIEALSGRAAIGKHLIRIAQL